MLLPFKSGAVENEHGCGNDEDAGATDRIVIAEVGNELETLRNLIDDDTQPPLLLSLEEQHEMRRSEERRIDCMLNDDTVILILFLSPYARLICTKWKIACKQSEQASKIAMTPAACLLFEFEREHSAIPKSTAAYERTCTQLCIRFGRESFRKDYHLCLLNNTSTTNASFSSLCGVWRRVRFD